jgi:ornithine cyclodeaminase
MKDNTIKLISHQEVRKLGITPHQCIEWIEESFRIKYDATLPPKISIHPQGDDFFNAMPSLLPAQYGRYCIKVVHRIEKAVPSLGSDIMLYDSRSGNLLAIIDGDWITTMRTGAVTALATRLFKRSGVNTYSIVGLGNTARAAALCLAADSADQPIIFRLKRYKDQAEIFADRLKNCKNVTCEIIDDMREFISEADVIISCVTSAKGLFCEDDNAFQKGILVLPVHSRGFQNCDLCFDKVFADDRGHVENFRYFSQFKRFDELSNVLLGKTPGRENDEERILNYNVGLGLHDALYATKIYDRFVSSSTAFHQYKEDKKFWV